MSRLFNFKKQIKLNRVKLPKVKYGQWAIQIVVGKAISEKHKFDLKQYLSKRLKNRTRNVRINFVPNSVVTKRFSETRMGGGKSAIEHYQYIPRQGTVFMEIYNVSFEDIYLLARNIKDKIPCKIRLFKSHE